MNTDYTISKEEKKFFSEFSRLLFGPQIKMKEFVKALEKDQKKWFIDFFIFLVHPRVNRYGSKYILSEGLDNLVREFREEYKDIVGKFYSSLLDTEKKKFDEYWSERELFRTVQMMFLYTFSYNIRDKKKRNIDDYAVELVHFSPLEKKIGESFSRLILGIQTLGDPYDFYATSYVSDFEFVYGNYVEPVFNKINTKLKIDARRRNEITDVVMENNSNKFEKLFENIDSELRNALAHKSYYVDDEKKRIVFQGYRRKKKKISLESVEDIAFKMRLISYMLSVSGDYLSLSNNLAMKYTKAFLRNFIIDPKNFETDLNLISSHLMSEIEIIPFLTKISFLVPIFNKMILNFGIIMMLKLLDIASVYDVQYITQFVAQFYNLKILKEGSKEEKQYLLEMKRSFRTISMEDKELEEKYRKFIHICLKTFIIQFPENNSSLKKLYDLIKT